MFKQFRHICALLTTDFKENLPLFCQELTCFFDDSFIKGIKPNSKGLGTYARVFNNEEFKVIIDTMDKNINSMIDDVNKANFKINPKIIKKKETTCKFCNYKDICFHTFKDYIDIREVVKDEVDG